VWEGGAREGMSGGMGVEYLNVEEEIGGGYVLVMGRLNRAEDRRVRCNDGRQGEGVRGYEWLEA